VRIAIFAVSCAAIVCGGFESTSCDAWDFATNAPLPAIDDVGTNFAFTLTALDDAHALLAGGTVNSFDVVPTAIVISLVDR